MSTVISARPDLDVPPCPGLWTGPPWPGDPPRETWPDHTQLPFSDGVPVENVLELPQAVLLSTSIEPLLQQRHPDADYLVGSNSGIYWRFTDPVLRGAVSPDWFYVPGVSPVPGRKSYVLWKELVPPLIVIEFVSGDGSEEREMTPLTGKFWVYEQGVRAEYYAIYEEDQGLIELYRLVEGSFELVPPDRHGHHPIEPLGLALGLHWSFALGFRANYLRWFDDQGHILRTGGEIAEAERQRAEAERQRAEAERQRAEAAGQLVEAERQRADRLLAQLRALGVEPEA